MEKESKIIPKLKTGFKVLLYSACTILTGIFITRGYERYNKNEDVCLVSYKRFNENEDQLYPTTTFCITNPILQEKMEKLNKSKVTVSSYKRYVQGHFSDSEHAKIDYDDVTVNINDYLLGYEIIYTNDSLIPYEKMKDVNETNWKGPHVSYRDVRGKCFSFDIPYNEMKNIKGIAISLSPTIFTNRTRPSIVDWFGEQRAMTFSVHLKNQNLVSYAGMQQRWNKRKHNAAKHFTMLFSLTVMDVIFNRNKPKRPCYEDWKHYDEPIYYKAMANK